MRGLGRYQGKWNSAAQHHRPPLKLTSSHVRFWVLVVGIAAASCAFEAGDESPVGTGTTAKQGALSGDMQDSIMPSAGAETIWNRPTVFEGSCFPSLVITAIQSDGTWLYLHAEPAHAPPPTATSTAMNAVVTVLSAAKSTQLRSTKGKILEGAGSWVAVTIAELPVGQFDLTLLGEATVTLRKSGVDASAIAYVPLKNRAEVTIDTAESVTVWADSSLIVEVR